MRPCGVAACSFHRPFAALHGRSGRCRSMSRLRSHRVVLEQNVAGSVRYVMNAGTRASKDPKARLTGAVYLAYFVIAALAESLVGRVPAGYSHWARLIATAGYV